MSSEEVDELNGGVPLTDLAAATGEGEGEGEEGEGEGEGAGEEEGEEVVRSKLANQLLGGTEGETSVCWITTASYTEV